MITSLWIIGGIVILGIVMVRRYLFSKSKRTIDTDPSMSDLAFVCIALIVMSIFNSRGK